MTSHTVAALARGDRATVIAHRHPMYAGSEHWKVWVPNRSESIAKST
jgi:hypothetical protein